MEQGRIAGRAVDRLSPGILLAITIGIMALGFGLRLYRLGYESLWYDELLELDIAQGPLGQLLPALRPHTATPLDYLIMFVWVRLGRSEFWVRFPAVVWGVLALPLAYRLGRSLAGRSAGLLFMALLAIAPLHLRYSQEARPYALVVLGVMAALYGFWRMRQTGRRRYFWLLQLGLLAAVLSHFFAAVIYLPLLLFAGLDLLVGHNRRRAVQSGLGLLLSGILPLVILLGLGWGESLFFTGRAFGLTLLEPERFTAAPDQKPNRGLGPPLSWAYLKQEVLGPMGAGDSGGALWLLNGLVALGWLYLLSQKRYGLGLLLLLWVMLPAAAILAFLVHRGTFFAIRYIITVLPAYLILLSLGILALPRWLGAAGLKWPALGLLLIVGGLAAATFGLALDRQYNRQDKEDWRLAARFISQNAGPDDAVIAVKAEPMMNWYYPPARAEFRHFLELETVRAAAAGAGRSWIVLSLFSSDIDGQIKAWLSEQGAVRFKLDPMISVYYVGPNVSRQQLLEEIQEFALPADHALYASLARENRRRPAVARRYYELAIAHAPDEETRAVYREALAGVGE